MSKSEKIKEQIGWLKIIFGILSAILISLSGWLATNYNSSEIVIVLIVLFLIIVISVMIMIVNKKAYSKMDDLEEL